MIAPYQLLHDQTNDLEISGTFHQCLRRSHQLTGFSYSRHREFCIDTYTIHRVTKPVMKTEITTSVAYRIQNQDQHSDRWFNDALHSDHAQASQSLASAREHYPTTVWRLLLITTTTEVIA